MPGEGPTGSQKEWNIEIYDSFGKSAVLWSLSEYHNNGIPAASAIPNSPICTVSRWSLWTSWDFWIRCTVLVLVFGMYRPYGEIRQIVFAHGCRIFVLRVGTWYFSGIGDLRVILLFVLGSRSWSRSVFAARDFFSPLEATVSHIHVHNCLEILAEDWCVCFTLNLLHTVCIHSRAIWYHHYTIKKKR